MATTSMLKAAGLFTFQNYLSSIPQGALFRAENVIIDRDGIIEPRRGIKVIGELPDKSKQLILYKDRVFVHYQDALAYTDNGDPATVTVMLDSLEFKQANIFTTPDDFFFIPLHGLEENDSFKITGVAPSPLVLDTLYYAVNVTINTFQVAAAPNGTPISLVTQTAGKLTFDAILDETESNLRVKYIEQNGNLYITTNSGVKKISQPSDYNLWQPTNIRDSGAPRGLDLELKLDLSTASGFFTGEVGTIYEASYRVLWGYRDLNNNLILGAPSYRATISNNTGADRNVVITFPVPNGVDSSYFFQVYRTQVALESGSGDEMRLVIEEPFIVSASYYDINTNLITVTDKQSDDIRNSATALYSNELTGDGLAAPGFGDNNSPPICKDITTYKETAFYANVKTQEKSEITLLGLDGLFNSSVTSFTLVSPGVTRVTLPNPHTLANGQLITLLGAGAEDGEYQIDTVGEASNTFKVNEDISAGVATTSSIYGSYFETTQGAITNRYFFVGRPEQTELVFAAKAGISDSSYFLLNSFDGNVKYCFYYQISSVDVPEPTLGILQGADRVYVPIDITDPMIVSDVEVKTKSLEAINATGDFYEPISSLTSTVVLFATNSGKASSPGYPSGVNGGGLVSIDILLEGQGESLQNNYARLASSLSPAFNIEDTAKSLTKVINSNSDETVYAYYTPQITSLPGSILFEDRNKLTTTFTLQAIHTDEVPMFNPDIRTVTSSRSDEFKNRMFFSKRGVPEAVGSLNSIDVGPKDKAILRVVALTNSMFIFKEEGIYRLTGEDFTSFNVILFDSSAALAAPDSIAVLNNQIYGLTTQGITTVSESGVGIISRPVEDMIIKFTSPLYTNYRSRIFGVSYEQDRSYLLFFQTNPTDPSATECLRYNTFTQSFTTWKKTATSGIVDPRENQLYIGAGDINALERERKTLTSRDYADREFERTITNKDNTFIYLDNAGELESGDVVLQKQYVTLDDINGLIKKLKIDPLVSAVPAIQALALVPKYGARLNQEYSKVVQALEIADPLAGFDYNVNVIDFASIQEAYNLNIERLNDSSVFFFSNYSTSVGSEDRDIIVKINQSSQNRFEPAFLTPYFLGECTHYKSIKSEIVWAHMSFGDPSIMKHVREGVILLENNALQGASLGFATDLSGNFVDIPFALDGNGRWGAASLGSTAWGGEGIAIPMRTLIPRQKQRCRYIKCRYLHSTAFFKYSIMGIAYTYEMNSERAYKA